jgi:hypothetical protein
MKPRAGLLFGAVLLIVAALVSCQGGDSRSPGTRASRPERCVGQGVPSYCRQLRVGDQVVRYALLPGARSTSNAAFLVDLGGPGYSALGMNVLPQFRRAELPSWMRRLTLVSLEEPWVTAPRSRECRSASIGFYKRARQVLSADDQGGHVTADVAEMRPYAQRLVRTCGLGKGMWGWMPTKFDEAVKAITSSERLKLDGAIGVSFGAVRTKYASGEIRRWVVLESPAPIDVTAKGFIDGLIRGATSRLQTHSRNDYATLRRRLGSVAASLNAHSRIGADRSIPTTAADLGPAIVALARLSNDDFKRYAPAVLSKEPSASVIGELSDRTWGRFGVSDVSPSLLAYLDEACPRYPAWRSALKTANGSPLAAFLTVYHTPCMAIEQSVKSVEAQTARFRVGASCIVASTDDPVTPFSYARAWSRRLPHSTLVPVSSTEHGSLNLARCNELSRIQTKPGGYEP